MTFYFSLIITRGEARKQIKAAIKKKNLYKSHFWTQYIWTTALSNTDCEDDSFNTCRHLSTTGLTAERVLNRGVAYSVTSLMVTTYPRTDCKELTIINKRFKILR